MSIMFNNKRPINVSLCVQYTPLDYVARKLNWTADRQLFFLLIRTFHISTLVNFCNISKVCYSSSLHFIKIFQSWRFRRSNKYSKVKYEKYRILFVSMFFFSFPVLFFDGWFKNVVDKSRYKCCLSLHRYNSFEIQLGLYWLLKFSDMN